MTTGGVCSECGEYADVIFRRAGAIGYGICIPCVAPQVKSVSMDFIADDSDPPLSPNVHDALDRMRGENI